MKQEEAKNKIVSEFLSLPKEKRTGHEATLLALKYSNPENGIIFKSSSNAYTVINGWLQKYIN